MKKHSILALAAALMVCAFAGSSTAGVLITAGDLLKFPKNATYDSTEVAIAVHAAGNAPSASQDTTGWYQLNRKLSSGSTTTSVMMGLQIDHQTLATSDSASYMIQWTSDEATVAGTRSNFVATAATPFAIASGSSSTIVNAILPTTAAGNWYRVVLWNSKVTNSNVARKFRVRPIFWEER